MRTVREVLKMRVVSCLFVVLLGVALVVGCAKKQEEAAQPPAAEETTQVAQLNKCPVCGMEIAAEADTITAEYEGKVYHFCSTDDKEKFMAEPQKYLKPDTTQAAPTEM